MRWAYPFDKLKGKVESLHEFNPMLGTRGCRLDVLYPEIAEMQTEAIISAAINVWKEDGLHITPEIMVPLVSEVNELRFVKKVIKAKADELIEAVRPEDEVYGRHDDRDPACRSHRRRDRQGG